MTGKTALVTGGGSGIGRAAARAFAREGARVAVADVDENGGLQTARLIQEAGGQALFIRTDVSQAAQVEVLVRQTVDACGRLDWAFNNAGISGTGASTAECAEEDWDRLMAVNLKGVWLCMKYELRQMLKQGSGAIVNNASVWGLAGLENAIAYAASKHGVVGLTRVAALECARSGIRVNAVCPGFTHTPLIDRVMADRPRFHEKVAALQPMGRLATPEEVAEAVVWLCSDAASFVTGHALSADGGLLAR